MFVDFMTPTTKRKTFSYFYVGGGEGRKIEKFPGGGQILFHTAMVPPPPSHTHKNDHAMLMFFNNIIFATIHILYLKNTYFNDAILLKKNKFFSNFLSVL